MCVYHSYLCVSLLMFFLACVKCCLAFVAVSVSTNLRCDMSAGMITSVGLSNIQYVNMRKTRNLCALGLSLFLGLWIPKWVSANTEHITTGENTVKDDVSYLN